VVETKPRPTLAIAGGLIGGVGVVTGAIFGALTFSEADTVSKHCANNTCNPPWDADLSRGNAFAGISTGAFIVGGTRLTLFVIGLATHHPKSPARTARGLVVDF